MSNGEREVGLQQLEAMRVFARLGEISSFTQTADSLGLPKASPTHAIQQLEAWLNTRRFQRSTRKVQLTHDDLLSRDRVRDLLAAPHSAGWHRSDKVSRVDGLHPLCLPSLTPEFQPVQQLWPRSDESLADRSFDDLDPF